MYWNTLQRDSLPLIVWIVGLSYRIRMIHCASQLLGGSMIIWAWRIDWISCLIFRPEIEHFLNQILAVPPEKTLRLRRPFGGIRWEGTLSPECLRRRAFTRLGMGVPLRLLGLSWMNSVVTCFSTLQSLRLTKWRMSSPSRHRKDGHCELKRPSQLFPCKCYLPPLSFFGYLATAKCSQKV